ncbi:VolA/Pla-1 family phospholipase [Vibrio sp. 10N]|uniref:VolA/Pla-1 family phospholipase n=1 Tax=Vibrio sp. 10N TaxID=3058938 RepID=UPI0028145067|nr:lysophospholipase VolA [Vibrio sp. 10N]
MKKTILATALSGALLLSGCGSEATQSGEATLPTYESFITASLAQPTQLEFILSGSNATVPVPNNLLFNSVDGTIEIPTDDSALSNPIAAMGQMDGWSTTASFLIPFSGQLDAATAAASVSLVKISDKMTGNPAPEKVLVFPTDYFVSVSGGNLVITPTKPLDPASEYLVAVNDSLQDSDGEKVGMSQSYASLKSKSRPYQSGDLVAAQQLVYGVEALVEGATTALSPNPVSAESIVYSAWFSTQSVGATLAATKGMLALAQGTDYSYATIWKDSANPNNAAVATIGQMTFGTGEDYATVLANDANFTKYIATAEQRDNVIGLYNLNTPNMVTVSRGTVNLPYYLEKGANWDTQPFESGSDSLAIITSVTKESDAEKAHFSQQLEDKGLDPTDFFNDPASKLQDIIGDSFTKLDGSRYDVERIVTQYSPVPVIKSVEAVNYLLFTPTNQDPDTGIPLKGLVIYQHGITSAKENSYFFANNLALQGYAVIAIDAPIHGDRSLDEQRSANANVLAYMNLSVLPVARDNIRQSMLDLITLRLALGTNQIAQQFAGTSLAALPPLATNAPSFIGHSLGGILGVPAVAQSSAALDPSVDVLFSFKNASFVNAGGQIANLLLGSQAFGPVVTHNVALGGITKYATYEAENCGTPGTENYEINCLNGFESLDPAVNYAELISATSQFSFAAQTVLDTADPINHAATLNTTATSAYMAQVLGDDTVPNNVNGPSGTPATKYALSSPLAGTEPLATALALTPVVASSGVGEKTSPFVKFDNSGQHSTFVIPQGSSDIAHHSEMQAQVASFIQIDKATVQDTSVLE